MKAEEARVWVIGVIMVATTHDPVMEPGPATPWTEKRPLLEWCNFMIFGICLLLLKLGQGDGLPSLERIFMERDSAAFEEILSREIRVHTDLRPILYDRGMLSYQQVLLAFDKLGGRFYIEDARVTNFQSDANYAWLEVYLHLDLTHRQTKATYTVTFAFYFKIAGSKMAISRWVLQDVH